jgi:hypothetical protein
MFEISGGCLRWLNELWCGILRRNRYGDRRRIQFQTRSSVGDQRERRPATFKPQRILTVGNRGYRATTSGTARFFCEEFRDAINRFVINPNRIFRVMDSSRYSREREVIFKIKDMTQIDNMQYKGSRADQAGKDPIVKILNSLQTSIYNRANVKHVSQTGLSIVLEFDAEQERNRPRQQSSSCLARRRIYYATSSRFG